jgi:hypothetical protein
MPIDESYPKFLRGLRPVALGLKSSRAALNRAAYQRLNRKEGRNRTVRSLRDNYEVERVKLDFFDVVGRVELDIRARGDKKSSLAVECEFEAHFHCEVKVTKEFAERFAQSELRVFMWPYFRQFVSDTTARMSVRPVLIPLAVGPGEESRAKVKARRDG